MNVDARGRGGEDILTDFEQILNGPDYVRCTELNGIGGRWHKRQCAANRAKGREDHMSPYARCLKCSTGKEAELTFGMGNTHARDHRGFTFNPIYKEKSKKKADKMKEVKEAQNPVVLRPCKVHPDKPARINSIGKSTGFCNQCLTERGKNQFPSGTQKKHIDRQRDAWALLRAKEAGEIIRRDDMLEVLLSPVHGLLGKLQAQADKDMRTVEAELLYLLKEALSK